MDKMRIMIIEDDKDLSELIKMYLIPEGWIIDIYNNGKEALKGLKDRKYNLILMDLLLPGLNGFDICKIIRKDSTIPIIMVTALERPIHKVQGLNIGADDYITKPFDPAELVARIKSQLRRSYEFSNNNVSEESYERKVEKLILNKKTHKALYNGLCIELTPIEFEILWMMMGEPDSVHSMEDIHYKIWGDRILEREVNPVMSHIRRIRGKFETIGIDSIIKTIWGVGYKLNA